MRDLLRVSRFRRREIQGQGAGRLSAGSAPAPDAALSLRPHRAAGAGQLWSLLSGQWPRTRGSTLMTYHPKAPPPDTITLGRRVWHVKFEETQAFSP